MKLYDLMKIKGELNVEAYDKVYDASVTVCIYDENENDFYDKFCMEIIKKVDVVKINDDSIIVDWCKFIKDNMENFKVFAREHWIFDYENDEDEFVYQWIKEIHYYLAGYVSEDMYEELIVFLENLN